MEITSTIDLYSDLSRLARFGANITDAFSCFIFLPSQLIKKNILAGSKLKTNELVLTGYHSLCSEIFEHCSLEIGSGMIGWVAQNNKTLHIAPFDNDSRSLGMYRNDQGLKSFLAVPIPCNFVLDDEQLKQTCGVIACDSKKSFSFSKLQCKLLEDLAYEISNSVRLTLLSSEKEDDKYSWDEFVKIGNNLLSELGRSSVDVLRVHLENFNDLEMNLGTRTACNMVNKIYQLIRQSLPENFPSFQMPNGDFVLIMDNMMSVFYQNKIEALAKHVMVNNYVASFKYLRQSFSNKQNRLKRLEEVVLATNSSLDFGTNTKRLYVFGRS